MDTCQQPPAGRSLLVRKLVGRRSGGKEGRLSCSSLICVEKTSCVQYRKLEEQTQELTG